MNYENAKEWLECYRSVKGRIKFLDRQIERFKKQPVAEDGLAGTSYDGINTGATYSFSSIVENQVIKSLDQLERMEQEREALKEIIDSIDSALNSLRIDERRIIKLYYLGEEKMKWWQVANVVGYSQKHVENYLHRKALYKIAIVLSGSKNILERLK